MKILFVITLVSFLVLALAVFLVTRHVRRHPAEHLEPVELVPAFQVRKATKQQRRASRRKTIRAAA